MQQTLACSLVSFWWVSEDRYHASQSRHPEYLLESVVGNTVKVSCLLSCLSLGLYGADSVYLLLHLSQEDQAPAY